MCVCPHDTSLGEREITTIKIFLGLFLCIHFRNAMRIIFFSLSCKRHLSCRAIVCQFENADDKLVCMASICFLGLFAATHTFTLRFGYCATIQLALVHLHTQIIIKIKIRKIKHNELLLLFVSFVCRAIAYSIR